jgi:hypothetical protein
VPLRIVSGYAWTGREPWEIKYEIKPLELRNLQDKVDRLVDDSGHSEQRLTPRARIRCRSLVSAGGNSEPDSTLREPAGTDAIR